MLKKTKKLFNTLYDTIASSVPGFSTNTQHPVNLPFDEDPPNLAFMFEEPVPEASATLMVTESIHSIWVSLSYFNLSKLAETPKREVIDVSTPKNTDNSDTPSIKSYLLKRYPHQGFFKFEAHPMVIEHEKSRQIYGPEISIPLR